MNTVALNILWLKVTHLSHRDKPSIKLLAPVTGPPQVKARVEGSETERLDAHSAMKASKLSRLTG